MSPILSENAERLATLCKQYRVGKLYAFGSVITEHFSEATSDLDLLVELEPMSPIEKGETLLNFWDALEELFQRKVDLLTDQPIKNEYLRDSINSTKRLIYES
ncbi:nucleotidyltransferase family protein [Telluribacter sp.]|uniref:nucleotidyltransferase family protein n=1 Tax=Telluribacter sp. TaxID=1978767 RepID=UPI002E145EB8|nr:nucleotidyltransferase domain-containing protein [Telluribacter sp.]